jgi:hypothetical protein
VSDFPHTDSLNINVLKHCVQASPNGSSIVGDGASTWGSTVPTVEREKSLLSLFFGLFVSPELRRENVSNEFQERLILPCPGKNTLDRLTLRIAHSLIPFYHSLLAGPREFLARFFRGFVSLWHRQRRSADFSEGILTSYSAIHIIHIASITITFCSMSAPHYHHYRSFQDEFKGLGALTYYSVYCSLCTRSHIFLNFQLKTGDLSGNHWVGFFPSR